MSAEKYNTEAKRAIARSQALARERELTQAEQQARNRAVIEADQAAHAHENDPRWY